MYKINIKVFFEDLNKKDFKSTWVYQKKIFNIIINIKIYNRFLKKKIKIVPNYLLFVEHNNVYTLGKIGSYKNLLLNNKNIIIYKIDRGGDITYHGPGQLVCYPIFDLINFYLDINKYLRIIEEVIIKLIYNYCIKGYRISNKTGVWVYTRKICAIGIKVSRFVTMHGFALNVNTDLSYFNNIIPCGIKKKSVTSINVEKINHKIDMYEVKFILKKKINFLFKMKFI
ncbi:lipoyl(octanoyl) transferase LipB [Candidatus Karelsulcia muelleri]|uniref:lipoyl(octanoyl) transferase LipB n=1 Tax=Candidatus Karelsulcia muelleri TaxID=336810 RepID=UPI0019129FC1|nr:lipoyl(octanoyl) transferase LipB [Candidatus Karelsulcia muelleri]MBU6942318.1 lipoyl(octanoyl) transferase LipB [Candidatus Karelsulcia muelleri]